jgi:hypothetical protein
MQPEDLLSPSEFIPVVGDSVLVFMGAVLCCGTLLILQRICCPSRLQIAVAISAAEKDQSLLPIYDPNTGSPKTNPNLKHRTQATVRSPGRTKDGHESTQNANHDHVHDEILVNPREGWRQ